MDRIERIDSPRPHERTWAVTPARERDAERDPQQRRKQQPPAPPAPAPRDDDEPPHLVDVQA